MESEINRRGFLKTGAAAGVVVSKAPLVLEGADDRKVRLGFIGVGGRGSGLLRNTLIMVDDE